MQSPTPGSLPLADQRQEELAVLFASYNKIRLELTRALSAAGIEPDRFFSSELSPKRLSNPIDSQDVHVLIAALNVLARRTFHASATNYRVEFKQDPEPGDGGGGSDDQQTDPRDHDNSGRPERPTADQVAKDRAWCDRTSFVFGMTHSTAETIDFINTQIEPHHQKCQSDASVCIP